MADVLSLQMSGITSGVVDFYIRYVCCHSALNWLLTTDPNSVQALFSISISLGMLLTRFIMKFICIYFYFILFFWFKFILYILALQVHVEVMWLWCLTFLQYCKSGSVLTWWYCCQDAEGRKGLFGYIRGKCICVSCLFEVIGILSDLCCRKYILNDWFWKWT